MADEKARENRLRRWAARLGYTIRKDRSRSWGLHHQGGYMLVISDINGVAAGADFDLTLEDVEAFLQEEEANLRAQRRPSPELQTASR